jgi:hypothetical protein
MGGECGTNEKEEKRIQGFGEGNIKEREKR